MTDEQLPFNLLVDISNEDANKIIPDNVREEMNRLHTKEELKLYLKSKKCQLDKRKKCQRTAFHCYVDFFFIHDANDEAINMTRLVICRDCLSTNLRHDLYIHLTFGDKWYHSIYEQDEPFQMTEYAKQVLQRSINHDRFEPFIQKALSFDMRFDNCNFRNSESWIDKHAMKPMLLNPFAEYWNREIQKYNLIKEGKYSEARKID